jgi:hypothetical protein
MFTLIVGKPPFETPEVKETYKKIKKVQYQFPSVETRKRHNMPEISYDA